MSKPPKRRSKEFKLNLAIEAIKGEKPITKIASEHSIHPRQITRWRDQLLEEAKDIFIHKTTQKCSDNGIKELLLTIDKLNEELNFLKKKLKRDL